MNRLFECKDYKEVKRLFIENTFTYDSKYLQEKYNKFNKIYFNNSLGRYPIKVKTLKSVGGKVVSKGIKNDPSTWVIKGIEFSDFTDITEAELWGILVHEMIHVELIEQGLSDPKYPHDITFTRRQKEIQELTPFDVPITEDITYRAVNSDKVKSKPVIAFFMKAGDGWGINTYNLKAKGALLNLLADLPEEWLESVTPLVVISDNVELQKYPQKISVKSKGMGQTYRIDQDLAEKIINEGEEIYNYNA